MVQLVNGMEYDVHPALSCESIVCSIQLRLNSVFSQVDMFHAIAAAACAWRTSFHLYYTSVYSSYIASFIAKLNDAL